MTEERTCVGGEAHGRQVTCWFVTQLDPARLFHINPNGHYEARYHIVAGDGPRQFYNLLVRQYGAHPLKR
jgi:hypothetical protein